MSGRGSSTGPGECRRLSMPGSSRPRPTTVRRPWACSGSSNGSRPRTRSSRARPVSRRSPPRRCSPPWSSAGSASRRRPPFSPRRSGPPRRPPGPRARQRLDARRLRSRVPLRRPRRPRRRRHRSASGGGPGDGRDRPFRSRRGRGGSRPDPPLRFRRRERPRGNHARRAYGIPLPRPARDRSVRPMLDRRRSRRRRGDRPGAVSGAHRCPAPLGRPPIASARVSRPALPVAGRSESRAPRSLCAALRLRPDPRRDRHGAAEGMRTGRSRPATRASSRRVS